MKCIFAVLAATALLAAQDPIRGFPQSQWNSERKLEAKAIAIPEPARIRAYMERMAREPHHAGSAASLAVAEYALGLFQEWGFDAHIEHFEALLPYPTSRALEMVSPIAFTAKLKEPAIAGDPYSGQANQLPTYNAYSAAGDVTAPLVYVNYGLPEDYEYLAKQGIDPKGKIVIARYGKSWRGTKPKVAQEHGAVGCLIYSDPHEDGYFQGDVYPKGALRPPNGVQRGSVMDMPLYVGDPLSPGWASEKGAKRLTIEQATTLMKIPVMPISYADATPLLSHLEGPVAPENWRGALPLTYHIGPGPATAHFKLSFDNSTRPLHDVIATIPGSRFPDQWVIYGNHHDAWVNGAHDPLSGATSLLETARALALLRKGGWQPERTIVFALWDGEEFGLLGSTEWAEKHADELSRKAVVYINSDTNGKGHIGAGGSPTLEQFMTEVLRDLPDPSGKGTLLESARSRGNPNPGGAAGDKAPEGFHLGPLGSGSDYVAFIHHIGTPSLNLGFGGPNQGGVYHSIYDDFTWFTRFIDPDFSYGRALSQVTAISLMRLADAPLLPLEFGRFSETVRRYVTEMSKQPGSKVNFAAVLAQLGKIDSNSKAFDTAVESAMSGPDAVSRLTAANTSLMRAESALLTPKGLPGREWYRNEMYAPGMYTGYGAKTLPGVREAAEAGKWDEANREVGNVAEALGRLNGQIEAATHALQ